MTRNKLVPWLVLFFLLVGCGFSRNIETMGLNREMNLTLAGEKGFKTVVVADLVYSDAGGIESMPENQKEVSISLRDGVEINQLVTILEEYGLNLVIMAEDKDRRILVSSYKGGIKDLLRAVQDVSGVEFQYRSGVLTAVRRKKGAVRVLASGGEKMVEKVLKGFGVAESFYDEGLRVVVFESDCTTFNAVRKFFVDNPLFVTTISVALIETEVSKEEKVGIDWHRFVASMQGGPGLEGLLKVTGASSGAFVLSASGGMVNLVGVLNSLESFRKFTVVQNSAVSVVSGESGMIDVSDKIPYVEEISITGISTGNAVSSVSPASGAAAGSTNVNTVNQNTNVLQSTRFGEVASGLVIKILPIVSRGLVSADVDIQYNSVKEFIEVGQSGQSVSRPVVSTKNLITKAVMVPGDLVSVGSMRFSREGKAKAGLWGFGEFGVKSSDSRYYEIVALMSCQVTEYQSKKN